MSFPAGHEHRFGDWFNSGTCQRRACECGETETRDHNWGPWLHDFDAKGRRLQRENRICYYCRQEETR